MGSAVLFNAAHMQEIEDGTITSGLVDVDGHLILTRHDGSEIDTGNVVGADGADGPAGADGADGPAGADGADGPAGQMPIGSIYAKYAAEANDLELNGQAVSRSTYAGLFALYGTTYGAGDGSTTFNVPDLRKSLINMVKTSAQNSSATAGSPIPVIWDSASGPGNSAAMWSAGANTKIFPNRKGWWRVSGKVHGGGTLPYFNQIRLNGTNIPSSVGTGTDGNGATPRAEALVQVTNPGTDYFELYFTSTGSGSQGITTADTQMMAEYVGDGEVYDPANGPKLYVTALGAGSPSFGGSGGGGAHLLGVAYPWMAALVPTWALELNGQTIAGGATTFSGLAALYPSWVSGSDLVLPDWTGRVPAGYKSGDATFGTLGALVGEATHVLTVAEMPAHQHSIGVRDTDDTGTNGLVRGTAAVDGTAIVGSTGGGGAHNNIPPEVVVKWIVCAATDAGEFDTEVQTALVNRITVLEDITTEQVWQRVIPTGLASFGATATYDSTTGVVTCPTGTSNVRIDGVLAAGYETWVKLDLGVDSKNSTDYSMLFRMVEGTTPNTGSYNFAGLWTQYNGTDGLYTGSGISYGACGATSGNGTYVDFSSDLRLTQYPFSSLKAWFWQFESFSAGSARGVKAGGQTPFPSVAFTGLFFFTQFGGASAFEGTIQVFRRKRTS